MQQVVGAQVVELHTDGGLPEKCLFSSCRCGPPFGRPGGDDLVNSDKEPRSTSSFTAAFAFIVSALELAAGRSEEFRTLNCAREFIFCRL